MIITPSKFLENTLRIGILVGCIMSTMLLTCSQSISALSQDDYYSIINNTPFFDPNASPATGCNGMTNVSDILPGAVPEPYSSLFTQAASSLQTNPQFVAALFLDEHDNAWPNPNGPWASSSAGAQGPFQFLPGTWDGYKIDGNNDGVTDIQNLTDAAYTAANWAVKNGISPTTPLGDITRPFANSNSMLYKAAAYNWGGGNVQEHTNSNTSINDSAIPTATQNYVKNTYALISSGFTKGDPSYGNIQNLTNGVGTGTGALSFTSTSCSGGIVAGSVVQTAINLSWPEPFSVRDPSQEPSRTSALTPTQAYAAAIAQYYPGGASDNGADCGVFVSIVMRASGADPNYPQSGTMTQQNYVEQHPEKYTVITNAQSTADLQPGDILIVNANGGAGADGHTMIYVGPQNGGYNEASASLGDRMPNLGVAPADLTDPPPLNRGHYIVARLIH